MRDTGGDQRDGRRELVVRGGQGRAPVEHGHAERGEPVERPEPGLDAVERLQHVEPAERDVSLPEPGECLGRAQDDAEPDVGRRHPMRDEGERRHVPGMVRPAPLAGKGGWPGRPGTFSEPLPAVNSRAHRLPTGTGARAPRYGPVAGYLGERHGSAWEGSHGGRHAFPGHSVTPVTEARLYDRRAMRTTLEREVKLDARRGFVLPELPGEPLADRVFTSTYYDTPPRSLAQAGITLRRRVEQRTSLWQLKLPRAGAARAELEARGPAVGPPAELAALVAMHVRRHGALEPVAALRTNRRGVRVVEAGRAAADVTVDEVDVLDNGSRVQGFVEVEIELVDGDDADLDRLARVLRRAGARRSDGSPKLLRVLALAAGAEPGPRAAPRELLAYRLRQQLRRLEQHDPGVRLGDEPEDVHKFRVATRRSRALVRAARPLVGDHFEAVSGELRWLAGLLGPVRDLDVLLARLRAEVATLDGDESGGETILGALVAERDRDRAALLEAIDSDRYDRLLDAFGRAIEALPDFDGKLRPLAAAEFRLLEKAAAGVTEHSPDTDLHALRIRAKRARYTGELAAAGGGKRLAGYVEAVTEVQDVIGENQDAVVAEERLRGLAEGAAAVAAGRLIEREQERRRRSRTRYPDAIAAALAAGRLARL